MSIYSGKCDLYDWWGNFSDDKLKRSCLFVGDSIVPLRIESQHDLAPYYPYIVYLGTGGKNGDLEAHISERSYVDASEEEHLFWRLRDCIKYYRWCKRNKTQYDEEEAVKKMNFFPDDIDKEIAKRVGMYGAKATTKGLHLPSFEYDRNRLLEEMIRLGWDKRKAKYWIWKDWKYLLGDDE